MTKAANSAPPVPHGVSTDGKGCHLDLPAVEMFQKKMDSVFGKLNGLSGIADDTFVYGKSEKGHDQHILNVLDKVGTIMYGSTQTWSSLKYTNIVLGVYVEPGWTES